MVVKCMLQIWALTALTSAVDSSSKLETQPRAARTRHLGKGLAGGVLAVGAGSVAASLGTFASSADTFASVTEPFASSTDVFASSTSSAADDDTATTTTTAIAITCADGEGCEAELTEESARRLRLMKSGSDDCESGMYTYRFRLIERDEDGEIVHESEEAECLTDMLATDSDSAFATILNEVMANEQPELEISGDSTEFDAVLLTLTIMDPAGEVVSTVSVEVVDDGEPELVVEPDNADAFASIIVNSTALDLKKREPISKQIKNGKLTATKKTTTTTTAAPASTTSEATDAATTAAPVSTTSAATDAATTAAPVSTTSE